MSRIARIAVIAALAAGPIVVTAAPASAGPELPDCRIGLYLSNPPRPYVDCPPL